MRKFSWKLANLPQNPQANALLRSEYRPRLAVVNPPSSAADDDASYSDDDSNAEAWEFWLLTVNDL